MRHKAAGFTLVELMIVVAIAGVLVAIAIPSYNGYVINSNRAKAIVWANQLAAKQEVYYNRYYTYGTLTQLNDAGLDVPYVSTNTIKDLNDNYKIGFSSRSDRFTIRLWPLGSQAKDSANCRFIEVTEKTSQMEATSDLKKYCP